MKFGVIYHKSTKNIGDDVQAYAQSRLLPQVDYFLDREHLDTFKSEDDEPVALIMSAWYMWEKWNWPPSSSIYPKFVGFHYSDILRGRPAGMPVRFEFLKGLGGDYLKAHGPVGCRDIYTNKLMNKLGIDSYYSGCITLTLDAPGPKKKPVQDYVCLVDVDAKVEAAVRKQLEGSGVDIKVIPHNSDKQLTDVPWDERKRNVEELLTLYQNARSVITFRLHCLLPCLAMGTPVLLMRDSFKSIRFNPYHKWSHRSTPANFLAGKCDFSLLDPPANPTTYLETRNKLKADVLKFVNEAKKETRKASEMVKTKYSDEELLVWRHDTMKKSLSNWLKESRADWSLIAGQQAEIKRSSQNVADKPSTSPPPSTPGFFQRLIKRTEP